MRELGAAVALLVLLLLLATPAPAAIVVTPPGITCANDPRLTVPVAGRDFCFDSTADSGKGLLFHWTGSAWEAISTPGASGPANILPRYTGIGGSLTSSAVTDDGTNVTSTRRVVVRMDSNVLAPSVAVNDTRPGSGKQYALISDGGDLFLRNVTVGNNLIAMHENRVALAGADPNETASRPEGAVIMKNMAELKIIVGSGGDGYPVLMLDALDALQLSQYTDLHIGVCSGSPAMPAWCDPGAGGRGSVTIHGGRDRSGITGGSDLTVFNEFAVGANLGGAIELGGRYNASGPAAGFGFIAGRKANGTLGDVTGYMPFATTNAAGTFIERMRLALGLMVGTTTDSGAGIVNALNGYATNNVLGLTTTVDVLCDTTDPTKKRTLTIAGGLVTNKGTCA